MGRGAMGLEPAEFRRILGHWTTGVAIVATMREDGVPCGLTANAVASVSLEPPLVLACIERAADTHDWIGVRGYFSVNMLNESQERLARRFATLEAEHKFAGVAYRTEVTGAPVLEDALAWVDCRLTQHHPAGDHTIYVGEVVAGDAVQGTPLLYYRGGYGRFAP